MAKGGPGGRTVGRVNVKVAPDTSGFRSALRKQLQKDLAGFQVDVPVRLDQKNLGADVVRLRHTLDNASRSALKLRQETDGLNGSANRASTSMKKLQRSSRGAGRAMAITFAVLSLGAPAIGLVAGLIAGLPSLLAGLGVSFAGAAAAAKAFLAVGEEHKVLDIWVGIQDQMQKTYEKGFKPILDKAAKQLPKLEKGFLRLADAQAKMATAVSDVVLSSKGMRQINTIINQTAAGWRAMIPVARRFTENFLLMASEGAKHFGLLSRSIKAIVDDFGSRLTKLINSGDFKRALVGLAAVTTSLGIGFNKLFEAGVKVMGVVGQPLADAFDAIIDAIVALLPSLGLMTNALLPALTDILVIVTPWIKAVADAVADAAKWFSDLPMPVQTAVVALGAGVLVVRKLWNVVAGLLKLGKGLGGFIRGLTGLGGAAATAMTGVGAASAAGAARGFGNGPRGIKSLFGGILRGLPKALPVIGWGALAISIVDALVGPFRDQLTGKMTDVWSAIPDGFSRAWEFLTTNSSKYTRPFSEKIKGDIQLTSQQMRDIVRHQLGFVPQDVGKVYAALQVINNKSWQSIVDGTYQKAWGVVIAARGQSKKARDSWVSNMWGANKGNNNAWTGIANRATTAAQQAANAARNGGGKTRNWWTQAMNQARSNSQRSWVDIAKSTARNAANAAAAASRNAGNASGAWARGMSNASRANSRSWSDIWNSASRGSWGVQDAANRAKGSLRGGWYVNLYGHGQAIMGSLVNGLNSAVSSVQGFVRNITSWIAQNKGPISYDRIMWFKPGQAIMGGLLHGLESEWRDVQKFITQITDELGRTEFSPFSTADSAYSAHISADDFGSSAAAVAEAIAGWSVQIDKFGVARMVNSANRSNKYGR